MVFISYAQGRDFEVRNGGRISDIPNGAIVEGSVNNGGIQPHYLIDSDSTVMKKFKKMANKIGRSSASLWEKIDQIKNLVHFEIIPNADYDDPNYLSLLEKYRKKNKPIPLSKYVSCSAGVCRENALLMHILLKEAGIENQHVYASVSQFGHVEDHAFVIVKDRGANWVVDPYNENFHGVRLKDLLSPEGVTNNSPRAPGTVFEDAIRRVEKIHNFPKVYIPTANQKSCYTSILNELLVQ